MKVKRRLSNILIYNAKLVIVIQKNTYEKVSIKDYYRRLL